MPDTQQLAALLADDVRDVRSTPPVAEVLRRARRRRGRRAVLAVAAVAAAVALPVGAVALLLDEPEDQAVASRQGSGDRASAASSPPVASGMTDIIVESEVVPPLDHLRNPPPAPDLLPTGRAVPAALARVLGHPTDPSSVVVEYAPDLLDGPCAQGVQAEVLEETDRQVRLRLLALNDSGDPSDAGGCDVDVRFGRAPVRLEAPLGDRALVLVDDARERVLAYELDLALLPVVVDPPRQIVSAELIRTYLLLRGADGWSADLALGGSVDVTTPRGLVSGFSLPTAVGPVELRDVGGGFVVRWDDGRGTINLWTTGLDQESTEALALAVRRADDAYPRQEEDR